MAAIPAPIATIFGLQPARGTRDAPGWRMESATRDIATLHHLFSPAFACVLDGPRVFDDRTFRAHFLFVRSGELRVCQGGHWRTMVPGDIFCAFGWLPTALQGADDGETLVVSVPGWWAMQRLIDQFQVLPDLFVGSGYFAAPIITTLARALLQMPEGDDASAAQALTMIADLMRTALNACVNMDSAKIGRAHV